MEEQDENNFGSEVRFTEENVPVEDSVPPVDSVPFVNTVNSVENPNFPEAGHFGGERTVKAGKFLMTMRYVCGVNQTQLKTVIKETEKLMDFAYDDIVKKFTDSKMLVEGTDTSAVKREVCAVFDGLRTKWHQDKFLKETLQVIQPRCVSIDAKFQKRGEGQKRKVAIVEKNFFYVPFIQVLEKLLKHPDYPAIIQRNCSPDPDVLDCYTKGNLYKSNPLFQQHPDALRFVIFYDDAEFCKDLSSRSAGNQKLGCIYMTLDNIDPKYRGNLDLIWLLGLVNSSFVKEHGIATVLERVRLDLSKFEAGISLNGKVTFGTLIGISGDNLGSHECGGFKCGFTAECSCRTCVMKREALKMGVKILVELLRTPEQYNQQVAELNLAKTLKERQQKSTEFGINEECAMNKLSYYHAVHGLPPDPMHDLLEGALSRGVLHIVVHCVVDLQLVSLDWLNSTLQDFDYGYSEVSLKPSPIRADHLKAGANLRQSATQMWTLATVLPLILGPLVDENDEEWEHYINLLEITRMVFSSEIRRTQLPYLASLIESYHDGYLKLYGHLKPKDHFLGHYPHLWDQYGSLLDFNCLRSEANHHILKKFVSGMGNYINIPKSASVWYQVRQAIHWQDPLIRPIQYGVKTKATMAEQLYKHLFSGAKEVVVCSWVKVGGLLFKKENCYLTIGCDSDNNPVFAKVLEIMVWPELFLICQTVKTVMYDTHFSCYEIADEIGTWRVVRPTDLVVRRIYHAHNVETSKYIAMKECAKGLSF